ncbi:MAG: hypothetical protein Q7K11_01360 [Candidatus Berkelbacteria bacterium]|nr:hypothetical protein [Candidatus Berkelbacteria bacterium]
MENKLNVSPLPKVRIEDVTLFGKLLSKSRSALGKNITEIVSETALATVPATRRWEQGDAFPEEDKLPAIAEAYSINLEELIRVLKISKEAREMEKNVRKNPKLSKKIQPDFPSSYGHPSHGNVNYVKR